MPAGAKVVRDGAEGSQELLGVCWGREALEHPFSSPCRPVRVFCSVVQAVVLPMLDPWQHAAQGGRRAGEFVRDHHPWLVPTPVDDTPQEGLGRFLVASRLDEGIVTLTSWRRGGRVP